jgi:hypothetical protein
MIDLSVFRRKIDLVLRHHGIADDHMVDDIMQILMQVAIAAALKDAEPVYRTKAGTLLTEEVIQELADEAERRLRRLTPQTESRPLHRFLLRCRGEGDGARRPWTR